jgi:hypothetical protein
MQDALACSAAREWVLRRDTVKAIDDYEPSASGVLIDAEVNAAIH